MSRRATAAAALLAGAVALSPLAAAAERILSVGGSVTEIIFALGEGERVIARDTTSTYPEAVVALPDVGYVRRLSPEGVLSVSPDLIVTEEGAGPPEALEILTEAAIPIVEVPEALDAEGMRAKIMTVAEALDVAGRGAALAEEVAADLTEATAEAQTDTPRRVLFVLSVNGGRIMAAGQGTGADAMIRMAGGVNAVEGVEGYRLLSDEAINAADPEVILMMDHHGDQALSDESLFAMPALAGTSVAQSGAVIRMDGLKLLGFTPRVAEAVRELAAAFASAGAE